MILGELSAVVAVASAIGGCVVGALALTAITRGRRAPVGETGRFDLLMAEMSDAVVVRDAAGGIVWGSRSVQRVFGYAVDEMVGTSIIDLVHPDDLAEAAERMEADTAVPGPHPPIPLRARHADGHWIDVEVVATNLLDDHRVGGVVLNVRDISDRVQRDRELARQRDHSQAILDTTSSIILSTTPDGAIVSLNRAAEELVGFRTADVVGQPVDRFVPEDERAGIHDVTESLIDGTFPGTHENHWVTASGERRLIRWTNTALRDDAGRPNLLIGTGVDITDERQAQADRVLAAQRFRLAFDHAPGGIALLAADGTVLDANKPLAELLRLTPDEVVGLGAPEALGAPIAAPPFPEMEWDQAIPGRRRRDDRTIRHRLTPLTDAVGGAASLLLESTDVTAARLDQRLLEWQASHDPLTGLANRTGLIEHLSNAMERSDGDGLAVLLLDLDGFKAVNDRLGHHAGDAVLATVATRLSSVARADDLVVRLGGDEFVLVAAGVDADEAAGIAHRIEQVLAEVVPLGKEQAVVGASVGVRLAQAGDTPESLLMAADHAMYEAKEVRMAALRPPAV